ncbi:uncharacterized protein F4807DRAFT_409337 [Annulohypoxylon truncatum]|uniref:uncharacterized protein n=1 Tax=Annulohypoxylon truncatum TaxID=327061 RepID=UPI002008B29A|nr:uncharacterized protein F4807DRAFT_409337 [Annulohypoxylon truncatum]KAI1213842.1 hypothetical protein F4807DRAFT_409337 [Annulohypoxylon truncatum]
MATASNSRSSNSAPPGHTPARRTPTNSSYYDFNGVPYHEKNPNSATWMYARDARAQQAGLPPGRQPGRKYPSPFGNGEKLALTTPGSALSPDGPTQWLHHPLIPGTTTTCTGKGRKHLGGVRSVYTANDPNTFDVMYHNRNAGLSANGNGNFEMSKYHPAAEGQGRP